MLYQQKPLKFRKPQPPQTYLCRDCGKGVNLFNWQLKTAFKPRCNNCGGPLLSKKEWRDSRPDISHHSAQKPGSITLGINTITPSIVEPSRYTDAGLQKADQTSVIALRCEISG